MTFQVGTNASDTLAVDDDLGMSSVVVFGATLSGLSLTSGTGATAALASLDDAISSVSSVRSTLGATQNRLSTRSTFSAWLSRI